MAGEKGGGGGGGGGGDGTDNEKSSYVRGLRPNGPQKKEPQGGRVIHLPRAPRTPAVPEEISIQFPQSFGDTVLEVRTYLKRLTHVVKEMTFGQPGDALHQIEQMLSSGTKDAENRTAVRAYALEMADSTQQWCEELYRLREGILSKTLKYIVSYQYNVKTADAEDIEIIKDVAEAAEGIRAALGSLCRTLLNIQEHLDQERGGPSR